MINQEGVQPDPESVRVLLKREVPRNKSELQSFLGFANYYREFIQDYAVIAAPIQHLVRTRRTVMEWTPECQRAFEILKTSLCSAPKLSMPTEDCRFYLDTDDSEVAVAAICNKNKK